MGNGANAKQLTDVFEAGSPSRPEDVRNQIKEKQHQAEVHRQQSDEFRQQEKRLDADVHVARQLETERTQEQRELQDRVDELDTRAKEINNDAGYVNADVSDAADRVIRIKRSLGEPIASDTELQDPNHPDGPRPAYPVETDPAKIAILREQLVTEQAAYDKAVTARAPFDAELKQIQDEKAGLEPQLKTAADNLQHAQEAREQLQIRANDLEDKGNLPLIEARSLEIEVRQLTEGLPDTERAWQQYVAQHPEAGQVVDVGPGPILDIHVDARRTAELFVEGRREEAGDLEKKAAAADQAAVDADNGARSRLDLAQRRDEEATNLTQRADAAAARIESLRSDATAAREHANQLAADADRATQAANSVPDASTDQAATLKARATELNNEAVNAATRAGSLESEANRAADAAASDRTRAAQLTQQSTDLKVEASTMQTRVTGQQQAAGQFREEAAKADGLAKTVQDELNTNRPFEYKVPGPDGSEVPIQVPSDPNQLVQPPVTDIEVPQVIDETQGTPTGATPSTAPSETGTPSTGPDIVAPGADASDVIRPVDDGTVVGDEVSAADQARVLAAAASGDITGASDTGTSATGTPATGTPSGDTATDPGTASGTDTGTGIPSGTDAGTGNGTPETGTSETGIDFGPQPDPGSDAGNVAVDFGAQTDTAAEIDFGPQNQTDAGSSDPSMDNSGVET